MNNDANLIGRKVAKLRYQQNWSQVLLVARLQVQGCQITRDVLANIETRRSAATDRHVFHFAHVLRVDIAELFRP